MRFQLLALVFGAAAALAAPVVLPKAIDDASNVNVERQWGTTPPGWKRSSIVPPWKRTEVEPIAAFTSTDYKRVVDAGNKDAFSSTPYKRVVDTIDALVKRVIESSSDAFGSQDWKRSSEERGEVDTHYIVPPWKQRRVPTEASSDPEVAKRTPPNYPPSW